MAAAGYPLLTWKKILQVKETKAEANSASYKAIQEEREELGEVE